MKKIVLIGGGTVSYIRNHLALCAPAYGTTVLTLGKIFEDETTTYDSSSSSTYLNQEYLIDLYTTKMANTVDSFDVPVYDIIDQTLETNEDIINLVDKLINDKNVKIIIFNPALVDFDGQIGDINSGKYAERLKTSEGEKTIKITPSEKIIGKIRKTRKDIFVVGFKTTTNATSNEQYLAGLNLLKENSLNLVVANDTVTRNNMIITPEEARYSEGQDRVRVLEDLVTITLSRAKNTFTRSTVIDGDSIDWNSPEVPDNLRKVVNHCIKNGAYKPFRGKTVGHFAVKKDDNTIYTSKRKSNFNDLEKIGLVRVDYDGIDKVIAYGAKPSVGGMSQKIIFTEHSDAACIVHFHCLPKIGYDIPHGTGVVSILNPLDKKLNKGEISIRPQMYNECGSHDCGQNTSDGLAKVDLGDGDYLKMVYLDNHGPNIVFSKETPAEKIIRYIDKTFDLSSKTGGLVS